MFTRREWLFLIAILLMLEAWILNINYTFNSDQGVINYISFASTIASLLLAVLAIIYGFYQADGQKKSTSIIETQLGMMGSLQDSVKKSSDDIEKSLTQMAAVSASLRSMPDMLKSAIDSLGEIQKGVSAVAVSQDSLRRSMVQKGSTPEQTGKSVNHQEAARLIFSRASFEGDLIGYALLGAVKKSGKREIPLWKFVNDFLAKSLGSKKILKNEPEEWISIGTQYLLILKSLGCLSLNLKEAPEESTIEITSELEQILVEVSDLVNRP